MRTLVTMALPYANGSLHLGHFVEAIQTDVYVRALRAMGREVAFICANDMHGTPIEMSAAKAGLPPEEYVERIHREHREDYAAFQISLDEFYTTHSEENRLRNDPRVRSVVYVSKGGALERAKSDPDIPADMIDSLEGINPLPASLDVDVRDVRDLDAIANNVRALQAAAEPRHGITAVVKELRWPSGSGRPSSSLATSTQL